MPIFSNFCQVEVLLSSLRKLLSSLWNNPKYAGAVCEKQKVILLSKERRKLPPVFLLSKLSDMQQIT